MYEHVKCDVQSYSGPDWSTSLFDTLNGVPYFNAMTEGLTSAAGADDELISRVSCSNGARWCDHVLKC